MSEEQPRVAFMVEPYLSPEEAKEKMQVVGEFLNEEFKMARDFPLQVESTRHLERDEFSPGLTMPEHCKQYRNTIDTMRASARDFWAGYLKGKKAYSKKKFWEGYIKGKKAHSK